MSQLHDYFRELSEGKLDITKTVEYQFIKRLYELDKPIGLNDFAKQLNMTSIVYNFINLMTKAGLLSQSPEGIDTYVTLPTSGDAEPTEPSEVPPSSQPALPTPPPQSSPVQSPQPPQPSPSSQATQPPVPTRPRIPPPPKSPVPETSETSESSDPDINAAVDKLKQMTSQLREQQIKEQQQHEEKMEKSPSSRPSIPRPNLPPKPQTSVSTSDDDEVPEHIKEKLNQERAKTGSKKQEDKDIEDIFGNLGSLEDDLD